MNNIIINALISIALFVLVIWLIGAIVFYKTEKEDNQRLKETVSKLERQKLICEPRYHSITVEQYEHRKQIDHLKNLNDALDNYNRRLVVEVKDLTKKVESLTARNAELKHMNFVQMCHEPVIFRGASIPEPTVRPLCVSEFMQQGCVKVFPDTLLLVYEKRIADLTKALNEALTKEDAKNAKKE